MSKVSAGTDELLTHLLAWELLGAAFDPKVLLRQVPLPDLAIVLSNLESGPTPRSLSVDLIRAEHFYRTGKISGDWEITSLGVFYVLNGGPDVPGPVSCEARA